MKFLCKINKTLSKNTMIHANPPGQSGIGRTVISINYN